MDIPPEIDDYIKATIDDALGLPVSLNTLQLKLRASLESHRCLRDRYFLLLDKLREKDELIERSKAEAAMNAVAVKKFVEQNQRLAEECTNLASQCNKWESECLLYERDREALMDFGNEADERAKEAEFRVHELEEELGRVLQELKFYKHELERRGVESSVESKDVEQSLLDSILGTSVSEDEAESAKAFLEVNSSNESCEKLSWNSLRPSTQKVLALAAKVRALQNDKEHLRVNLTRAEEEVKLLFEENNILNEENKKLLGSHCRERGLDGADGKQSSSASVKRNKRKSSRKMSSPLQKKINNSEEVDSVRQPLSPLQNSPDCRLNKK